MFRSYLLTTWRNLIRHKTFSIINLSGLAIGMATCLLILQYVGFELSYDAFHQKKSRIYRIRNDRYKDGVAIQQGVVTYPMVPIAMKRDFSEVEDYVRIAPWIADHTLVRYEDKIFREKGLLFAEPSFFKVFSFPLLRGDPKTALREPMSIVLTETRAKEIFGIRDPMGQIVTFEASMPFKVTGIMRDVPINSHIQFHMLVSYASLVHWMKDYQDSWTFAEEVYGYLLLAPGANPDTWSSRLADFSNRYYQGSKRTGTEERFRLQALPDIHLHSHYQFELGRNGNAAATWGLLGVAVLIMVIAWSNYLNLSIARYAERAKEIGIRKIVGAGRGQLLTQFLFESLAVGVLSLMLALSLFQLLNPVFCRILEMEHLQSTSIRLYGLPFWVFGLLLFAFGAALSGVYPAFILPSFRPATILKGHTAPTSRATLFRKSLVIYQFAITIVLMAFTWVVYQQTRFMMQKELGLNIQGTLVVWGPMGIEWNPTMEARITTFAQEAEKLPQVRGAAYSKNVPGDQLETAFQILVEGNPQLQSLSCTWVGTGFFDLYGMHLLIGRDFLANETESASVIINQSAVKRLGFSQPERAIGKKIKLWEQEKRIVGVVNDHHQQSLHHLVEPTIYFHGHGQDGYFSIKVSQEKLSHTITQIKNLYRDMFKGTSFQCFFLEDYFNEQYQTEHRLLPLIVTFSGLAIFISCLGLWGLVLHAFSLRRREIGIRKVMGASVAQVVRLLSVDSLKSVMIAFTLGAPFAWWTTNWWLEDFPYRIGLDSWVIPVAGLLAAVLALVTVSFQALRAARQNPVEAMRHE
jgi:putative ABC transport system permease protein